MLLRIMMYYVHYPLSRSLSLSLCRPSLITILGFVLVGIGVVFGSEVECAQCHGKAVITAFLMVGMISTTGATIVRMTPW